MNIALKITSLLLSYPEQELLDDLPELKAALASSAVPEAVAVSLGRLVDDLAGRDLYEAQERYVHLFDRTRALSLHLFEHVHGESRDRGQAMVDLMALYETGGFEIDAKELPDYLPLFLEFLSTRPSAEAEDLLGQTAHITEAIGERLRKRESVYASAFAALSQLSSAEADQKLLKELMAAPEDDP
ncbi:MAG: nitrate reductase molybdenum cofactor assembly chaperone, partial [Martelella sp.]